VIIASMKNDWDTGRRGEMNVLIDGVEYAPVEKPKALLARIEREEQ